MKIKMFIKIILFFLIFQIQIWPSEEGQNVFTSEIYATYHNYLKLFVTNHPIYLKILDLENTEAKNQIKQLIQEIEKPLGTHLEQRITHQNILLQLRKILTEFFLKDTINVENPLKTFIDDLVSWIYLDVNELNNSQAWKSEIVTKELLDKIYIIVSELGLADCAKGSNIPFCQDGTIAFVDTKSFNKYPVRYDRLIPYLSTDKIEYWNHLTK